ncbi:geranylgeranylglycerol-phosphate geranylgeranyltransferase [Chitinispirillales bacterium ANBcel5]|uniref:geranylgeranylglycerol-phosphate geranylgeranyltransferase n=1 Tax=Cellulosispirillum alkaliphilum TaxID=3039283 RepID=UPI002A585913|nr:geranylgeranylglycerol-phosphate geranylgeranyltransferase [Chitinispirillales bacterium ANBcel5]
MNKLLPYLQLIRLANVVMTGLAVFLGIWLSMNLHFPGTALLMIAAMSATGFGNVINDIHDISSDCINHPHRPLPRGLITKSAASIYALILVVIALVSALLVSSFHSGATLVPLLILSLYAFYLKKTPLAGNFLVATLVAYALLFGTLPDSGWEKLLIPALLAFLLNFSREIVKDVQDFKGDKAAGHKTSAVLSLNTLKKILVITSALYLTLLFVPFALGDFGLIYVIVCSLFVLPLHGTWFLNLFGNKLTRRAAKTSKLLKFEMLAGLSALALDKLF